MQYLSSNTPCSIFHRSLYFEILKTSKCTLISSDFIPKTSELYHRMVAQGDITEKLPKQVKIVQTMFQKHM